MAASPEKYGFGPGFQTQAQQQQTQIGKTVGGRTITGKVTPADGEATYYAGAAPIGTKAEIQTQLVRAASAGGPQASRARAELSAMTGPPKVSPTPSGESFMNARDAGGPTATIEQTPEGPKVLTIKGPTGLVGLATGRIDFTPSEGGGGTVSTRTTAFPVSPIQEGRYAFSQGPTKVEAEKAGDIISPSALSAAVATGAAAAEYRKSQEFSFERLTGKTAIKFATLTGSQLLIGEVTAVNPAAGVALEAGLALSGAYYVGTEVGRFAAKPTGAAFEDVLSTAASLGLGKAAGVLPSSKAKVIQLEEPKFAERVTFLREEPGKPTRGIEIGIFSADEAVAKAAKLEMQTGIKSLYGQPEVIQKSTFETMTQPTETVSGGLFSGKMALASEKGIPVELSNVQNVFLRAETPEGRVLGIGQTGEVVSTPVGKASLYYSAARLPSGEVVESGGIYKSSAITPASTPFFKAEAAERFIGFGKGYTFEGEAKFGTSLLKTSTYGARVTGTPKTPFPTGTAIVPVETAPSLGFGGTQQAQTQAITISQTGIFAKQLTAGKVTTSKIILEPSESTVVFPIAAQAQKGQVVQLEKSSRDAATRQTTQLTRETVRREVSLFQPVTRTVKVTPSIVQKDYTGQLQKTLQVQQQAQVTIPVTPTPTPTVPFLPIIRGGGLKVPGLVAFTTPMWPRGGGQRKEPGGKRKFAYTPTLTGLLSGKTLKKEPTKRAFTGVEVRYPTIKFIKERERSGVKKLFGW